MYQKFAIRFNTISFTSILVLCLVLPFFFLPGSWSGVLAAKSVLLYGGVFLATSFWLLAQFVQGSLTFPRHTVIIALGVWVVGVLVSALASATPAISLWGRGFATDSFATVLVLSVFAFLVASFARDQKRLVTLFLTSFTGTAVVLVLQVILYVSSRTSFVSKYFGHVATQGTLVGSWVDFAYVATFAFLLGLLMYEVLLPKGFFKWVSLGTAIIALIVLIFLNFQMAWIIAIVAALLVFVYKSSVERSRYTLFTQQQGLADGVVPKDSQREERFPVLSFVALLVGLFFLLSSNSVGARMSHYAGLRFSDIRPSFSATTHVVRATLAQDPIWGAGGGRFGDMWNLYHPIAVNQSQFWNTSFESGFSTIESMLVTHGVLPVLALLAVLILSIIHGVKLFTHQFPDRFSRFIAVACLILLIGFVGLVLLTTPGLVLLVLGFMYIGLLLGVSTLIGKTRVATVHYLSDPRTSFFTILVLVISALAGFSAVFFTSNRFASIYWYNRALTAPDIASAQQRLDRAIRLSQNDMYWRTRTALFTQQFTSGAQSANPDKTQLQSYFTQAEQSAQAALSLDRESAINWLTLSQVYQLVATGATTEAYTNAVQASLEAKKRSPYNPVLAINDAQLALLAKDTTGALTAIEQALVLKPNYLDAYILRAQIRASQGDTQAPVEELTTYLAAAPFDDQGYLLLGQAYTALKNYSNALDAFNRARQINPGNPNALLGMINALVSMGQKTQAIENLHILKNQFPTISGIDEKITEIQQSVDVPAPVVAPTNKQTQKKK